MSPAGFSSARQALAELRPAIRPAAYRPDDARMDGITLIEPCARSIPSLGAIVMTGHGTIDTAVQAMQGGAPTTS